MQYYSTNKQSPQVNFKEAAIRGQAPDKGLYFPVSIPKVEQDLLENIGQYAHEEIAFRVIRPYTGDAIPDDILYQIVRETVNFPFPLVRVTDDISSLELFHGPTLAFKDVGARFMSRCLGYFMRTAGDQQKNVTVLVATSGDTGGAVASGFYEVEGVEVVILYPSGKVSPVQEKQLTAMGKNITALEIQGTFDDCQQIVKQAFTDKDINDKLFLTSANSINVARWLPQQFYYFFAYRQWADKGQPPVISVPSGNFGNICAGILAMQSGLPVSHFVAACNVNDVVSGFLQNGNLQPKQAVPTLSNAMDVGNPSNFVRILEIFNNDIPSLKSKFTSSSITDEETLATIRHAYAQFGYLTDPHGAVGLLALQRFLSAHPGLKGYFLETAHPVKFPDAVQESTGKQIDIPASLHQLMQQEKKAVALPPLFSSVKEYLLSR